MKVASFVMSSTVVAAVFIACGGVRDRGASDVADVDTRTETAPAVAETLPPTAEGVGATAGTSMIDAPGAWTDRGSVAELGATGAGGTVKGAGSGGMINYAGMASPPGQQPHTVSVAASTGAMLPPSTGTGIR